MIVYIAGTPVALFIVGVGFRFAWYVLSGQYWLDKPHRRDLTATWTMKHLPQCQGLIGSWHCFENTAARRLLLTVDEFAQPEKVEQKP